MSPQDPCIKGLNKGCFKTHPAFARQALAYRLLHLLIAPEFSKFLPKTLRLPLRGKDAIIPLDVELPPGTVLVPGCEFPPGWDPEEELPECVLSKPLPRVPITEFGPVGPLYTGVWEPGPIGPVVMAAALEQINITSSTKDGWVEMHENDWDYVHDAAAGTNKGDGDAEYNHAITVFSDPNGHRFWIYRSFFYFDLSAYSGQIVNSARLLIYHDTNHDSSVSAQEGTQADTLTTADYDAFTGPFFGSTEWVAGLNTIELNSPGVAFIRSKLGLTAKMCLREYTHDYLDVEPVPVVYYANGCKYANNKTVAVRPVLQLN